eukprot:Nitzschia sp. Nitz4//scaffold88_size82704//37327//39689//NITZ4_005292-RA/size82704-augustus-gene-0.80-mRNA-1//1//CDS//3329559494//5619//frame0
MRIMELEARALYQETRLFDIVVEKDYERLLKLYANNAREAVGTYLTMRSRWSQQQESKSEEKLDEFMQQAADALDSRGFGLFGSRERMDKSSFYGMIHSLTQAISGDLTSKSLSSSQTHNNISREAERLAWESSSLLSDSRPPSNFCVFNKQGLRTPPPGQEQTPPIFDGSVANATPPPLGGAATGASGGTGTILHLTCAMDSPLLLAFFLCMGADGRASHTAFRRLMVHEASCNGSINCLTLLLELAQDFAKESDSKWGPSNSTVPFMPDTMELSSTSSLTGSRPIPPLSMSFRNFRRENVRTTPERADFLATLLQFQDLTRDVLSGSVSELDAARSLLKNKPILESTRSSLIRSCAFKSESCLPRSFLRPNGCADGHGNTPLHWAAFKNEISCVSLLLKYHANPNARAHPSGWTPLHDAAYSNSKESIELLVDQGAHVDARANSGATPLCFAAQEDSSQAALLLLQKGADLTARCAGAPQEDGHAIPSQPANPHSRFSGYTPLHYCAHYNAHKASKILLANPAAKAAMETPDLSGRLPIHVAVARGSSDVLRELLHAGARVDIRPNAASVGSNRPTTGGPNTFFALPETAAAAVRRPPTPEAPLSPRQRASASSSPVTSPILRSMIPQEPINSTKPWNCLTQQAIDECKDLISKAEQSWSPERHLLFTPQDRKAVMELLRVGKRLEQQGVVFLDLWPLVLSFCGRGWFDVDPMSPRAIEYGSAEDYEEAHVSEETQPLCQGPSSDDDYLSLPTLSS